VAITPDQLAHRIAFGKAVSAWMRINNFSQQSIHDWAAAAGTAGPWNSSTSLLQRGKLDPKPQFFVAFGTLNKHLAEGTYKYVTDRKLKDRLAQAMPFLTEHDKPATATDFYSMFIGELQPAAIYSQPIALTDADADELNQRYRDAFRKAALDEMISPKELWAQLEPLARDLGMTTAQAKHLQAVLVGLDDYTVDQLIELTRDAVSGPLPSQLLFKG